MGTVAGDNQEDQVPHQFITPLPLRSNTLALKKSQVGLSSFSNATLSVYRTIAIGCGTLWALYLGVQLVRIENSVIASPVAHMAVLFFFLTSCAIIGTCVIDTLTVYRSALLTGGLLYITVLLAHIICLVFLGHSPFTGAGLGDYGGVPCIMLAAAIARQWALVLIIAVICLSVATNDNLLDAPWHMTSAGIFYSSVLMIPFVVFLHSSITTTRAADRLATRSLEVFFSASQQSMLRYLHTNFLGYLHDQVINQLRAVSLGITQTDVARESWNKATQNQNDTDQRLVHHLPLSQVIVGWKSTIRAVHPHARITAPHDAPFQKKVPEMVATTMLEATMEALANCAAHAPESTPTITIDIADGVAVTIDDNGPGFHLDQIPHDRAGIRIAISGRMSALPGGHATIDSTIGRGTTVHLSWSPHSPTELPQLRIPTVQELTGIGALRTPWSAAVFFAFTLVISYQFWPTIVWPVFIIALAAVASSLSAVLSGKQYRLELRAAVIAGVSNVVFIAAAGIATKTQLEHWPYVWYPWVFVLLCSYLLMRDRAAVGLISWITGVCLDALLIHLGIAGGTVTFQGLLWPAVLLLASWLMPRLVRKAAAQLPNLWREFSTASIASVMDHVQHTFNEEATKWVDRQFKLATDPSLPSHVVRQRAQLLELRLRDCIRCPLFDEPHLTESVWRARRRGATVTLYDDRLSEPDPTWHTQLIAQLVQVLDQLGEGGELSTRLYPPGRSTYATVLWSANAEAPVERLRF